MKRQPANILFLQEVRELVSCAKQQAAAVVNATLTHLYWQIGQRINHGKRAEYGKQIVATLAKELTNEFGPG